MALFYENKVNDRKAIYDAAEKWKNECLLDNKSLIWDEESIWTNANLDRFRAIFVENPDESGDSFDSKFKKQLENESDSVYKLAIEIMFIYYMFPYKGSISFKTKMDKLDMIASWKGIELDHSLEVFNGLKTGLGATGTFYNTSKYFEISFLFLVVENLKGYPLEKRKTIINDYKLLKRVADDIRQKVGKRVQMLHIFLHLLLPDYFERIASWGHKRKIVKAYSEYVTESSVKDTDEKLLMIRDKLQRDYPDEQIDFYETPEIAKVWREEDESAGRKLTDLEPEPTYEGYIIPRVKFEDVKLLQVDLVFENIELLFNQVITAIQNGKHIILTGPPGTGKSKLASKICELYGVDSMMVTAASNWSTYETIGGYRPDKDGNLYFNDGIFLSCVKNKKTNQSENKWLIIDEINRANIDKAFGSLFSVLTGDEVTLPFESKSGESIIVKPQGEANKIEPNDYTYVIPNDWRIIATMNTVDKASLYEMSYAFMRRFAFIPVGLPKDITNDLVQQYLNVWNMETYPSVETLTSIWKLINNYRKIGPAIVADIAKHTQFNDDFTSAIILYVLPQFEGLPVYRINEFITQLEEQTDIIFNEGFLHDFVYDFFDAGGLE
ncbi:AAA family ATPase [Halalkalibacter nanhaiisediminis]|uniref:Dynein-related subfamily AAA family protein n=1 Tax=Halalkalibacter nanhaiisediminis TaxID=688079 RepID=A0A562QSY3_9BACI|nr:AAA family ATPase [Halalkalibacter nanhaiisediminis]TWI59300.1 dynein-related subfamily AAA family protein [Halalkalibacter nanhaiisediminis]